MTEKIVDRPIEGECAPYFFNYIELVQGDHIMTILSDQIRTMQNDLAEVSNWDYGYAPGKWSIKEVIIHLMDAERVFSYRAMSIARGEKGSLPSYDHNGYMENDFSHMQPDQVMEEYKSLRTSTVHLFRGFSDEMWQRSTVVSGHNSKALAFPYMIAGHQIHHLNILKERYGV